jgi:hypothetical protein
MNEGTDMSRARWQDLSDRQRFAVLVLGSLQLSLAESAWTDLSTRTASMVNGSKQVWALVIAINGIGPISYFLWGPFRHADRLGKKPCPSPSGPRIHQDATGGPRRWMLSTWKSRRARSSATSGRTGPTSPPRSPCRSA